MSQSMNEEIAFQLPVAVERMRGQSVSGEAAIEAYVAAGMPLNVAIAIVQQSTDANGMMNADLFQETIEERMEVASLLEEFVEYKNAKRANREHKS